MRRSPDIVCAALLVAAAFLSAPAYAGDRLGIGAKVGTLGFGVDLTGRLTDWFGLRGSLNAVDVSESYKHTDVDYDANAKLGAYGVLADFHPFRGSFRLTAGLMRNRNAFDLTGTPTQNVQIGSTTYTPGEVGTLRGDVKFKKTVPYLGLGFGSAAKEPGRIRFVFDLGVLQQGSGTVSLSSSQNIVSQSDLNQEASDIEGNLKHYKFWPVIALGISVRI